MPATENTPIAERFDHILAVLSSQRFLKMDGLNNEVPFFIVPYAPAEENEAQRIRQQLLRKLSAKGVRVVDLDIYDLAIELLQQRGLWDRLLTAEPSSTKDQLKELLQGVLDPQDHLIPAIAKRIADENYDILFLSGVGQVFPYLRSHTILNNLQSTAKSRPTVLFFPGAYKHSLLEGASLDLFECLHDDKYYRAFNIDNCEA